MSFFPFLVDFIPPPPPARTETKQESLENSLLTYMGQSASEADLREAFCRDIDAYSFEFDKSQVPVSSRPSVPVVSVVPAGPAGPRDEKPARCDVVPQTACAVGYDSGTCSGGWKLVIPIGELRFRWFTSYWSYRSDGPSNPDCYQECCW